MSGGLLLLLLLPTQCYQQYHGAYLLLHSLIQQADQVDDKKLLTKCKLTLHFHLSSAFFFFISVTFLYLPPLKKEVVMVLYF